jgi:uncharacterized protein (TIGR03437 family)
VFLGTTVEGLDPRAIRQQITVIELGSCGGSGMNRLAVCILVSCLGFCSQASGQSGIITTVAGGGAATGDGGPATSVSLSPLAVIVDAFGNLFIASDQQIRKVSASGIIATAAGNGTPGFSGDGGAATAASLYFPYSAALDASGNLFIADTDNNRIRKVSASGVITTVAGSGNPGFSGDGGPATAAQFNQPVGLAVDASGNLFIADLHNSVIWKVSTSGIITIVAGNGNTGFSGDGGPATAAQLAFPYGVAADGSGNLFIADYDNNRIRKVSASGVITTVAGGGTSGLGDGGPATSASLNHPIGVALDSSGNLFIADYDNNRIRKAPPSGVITTVAGGGTNGLGDGGPATSAELAFPMGVAVDAGGNLFIADMGFGRIRKVSAAVASYSGCNGLPAPGNLQLFIASLNTTTGVVQVNGVVSGASNTAFTWNWGDGAITQGFFPQSHTYSNVQLNYSLQVTTHQTDGSTDCAQLSIQFNTQGAGPITSVTTAYAGPVIAQDTFIVVKGANLVPANTPASGAIWSSAPSFVSGLMPTQLGGVSVTVNNQPAFVYFYCSAATDPACLQDQLNILTPLDNTIGSIAVVVTSGGVSSPPFTANMQSVAPSFLLFTTAGYIAATHANGSLLGPTSLYPGSSTPAKPGETITLYAVGFGLPTTALVNGSAIQSGSLPVLPVCQVGGAPAALGFAGLISPGLYQLNLTIPAAAANGDNAVSCTYNGSTTPARDLISVQSSTPLPTPLTLLHDVTSNQTGTPNGICTLPPAVTSFPTTAPGVFLFFDVNGAAPGDMETTSFYRPDGVVYFTETSAVVAVGANGYTCVGYEIFIAGYPGASYPGAWTVSTTWNAGSGVPGASPADRRSLPNSTRNASSGQPLFTLNFNVASSQPGPQFTLTVAGVAGSGTVTPSPVGTSCGTNCWSYAAGTVVILTATPATGSTFGAWSGGCSGTGVTCTVAMNANLTVTATFNPPASRSTLAIVPGQVIFGTVDQNKGIASNLVSYLLLATGGNVGPAGYTWTTPPGSLKAYPPAIVIQPVGVVNDVTPPSLTSGMYPMPVEVSDGTNTVTSQVTINLSTICDSSNGNTTEPCGAATVPTNAHVPYLPNGAIGSAYSASIWTEGGKPPYIWTLGAGSLPPGISIDPAKGLLLGTPTAAGTFNFFVLTTDVANMDTFLEIQDGVLAAQFTLVVK